MGTECILTGEGDAGASTKPKAMTKQCSDSPPDTPGLTPAKDTEMSTTTSAPLEQRPPDMPQRRFISQAMKDMYDESRRLREREAERLQQLQDQLAGSRTNGREASEDAESEGDEIIVSANPAHGVCDDKSTSQATSSKDEISLPRVSDGPEKKKQFRRTVMPKWAQHQQTNRDEPPPVFAPNRKLARSGENSLNSSFSLLASSVSDPFDTAAKDDNPDSILSDAKILRVSRNATPIPGERQGSRERASRSSPRPWKVEERAPSSTKVPVSVVGDVAEAGAVEVPLARRRQEHRQQKAAEIAARARQEPHPQKAKEKVRAAPERSGGAPVADASPETEVKRVDEDATSSSPPHHPESETEESKAKNASATEKASPSKLESESTEAPPGQSSKAIPYQDDVELAKRVAAVILAFFSPGTTHYDLEVEAMPQSRRTELFSLYQAHQTLCQRLHVKDKSKWLGKELRVVLQACVTKPPTPPPTPQMATACVPPSEAPTATLRHPSRRRTSQNRITQIISPPAAAAISSGIRVSTQPVNSAAVGAAHRKQKEGTKTTNLEQTPYAMAFTSTETVQPSIKSKDQTPRREYTAESTGDHENAATTHTSATTKKKQGAVGPPAPAPAAKVRRGETPLLPSSSTPPANNDAAGKRKRTSRASSAPRLASPAYPSPVAPQAKPVLPPPPPPPPLLPPPQQLTSTEFAPSSATRYSAEEAMWRYQEWMRLEEQKMQLQIQQEREKQTASPSSSPPPLTLPRVRTAVTTKPSLSRIAVKKNSVKRTASSPARGDRTTSASRSIKDLIRKRPTKPPSPPSPAQLPQRKAVDTPLLRRTRPFIFRSDNNSSTALRDRPRQPTSASYSRPDTSQQLSAKFSFARIGTTSLSYDKSAVKAEGTVTPLHAVSWYRPEGESEGTLRALPSVFNLTNSFTQAAATSSSPVSFSFSSSSDSCTELASTASSSSASICSAFFAPNPVESDVGSLNSSFTFDSRRDEVSSRRTGAPSSVSFAEPLYQLYTMPSQLDLWR